MLNGQIFLVECCTNPDLHTVYLLFISRTTKLWYIWIINTDYMKEQRKFTTEKISCLVLYLHRFHTLEVLCNCVQIVIHTLLTLYAFPQALTSRKRMFLIGGTSWDTIVIIWNILLILGLQNLLLTSVYKRASI